MQTHSCRISKSICKFVGITQKSLATRKLSMKSKTKMNKKYLENKIIQRNAKVAVRSKKRLDFLCVQNPHNRIFHALAIVYLISRPENSESHLN